MKSKLNRIIGIVLRHIFPWPRDLERLAEVIWWPTFDVFIWGLMTIFLQKNQGLPAVFISFFVGALVLWMLVYRSQGDMGVLFLKEVWDHNLLNLLTSPLTIWEFLTATMVLSLVTMSISAVWMLVLAYILYTFSIFTIGWMLVPYIISLLVTGWSAGLVINGIIIQYGNRVQALAWTLILIIQPFSAVFYPVSVLPGWMQPIARLIPTSYVFEGMRQVLGTGSFDIQGLLVSAGLNIFYLILALLFFKNSFTKAKKSGMIVKFS